MGNVSLVIGVLQVFVDLRLAQFLVVFELSLQFSVN